MLLPDRRRVRGPSGGYFQQMIGSTNAGFVEETHWLVHPASRRSSAETVQRESWQIDMQTRWFRYRCYANRHCRIALGAHVRCQNRANRAVGAAAAQYTAVGSSFFDDMRYNVMRLMATISSIPSFSPRTLRGNLGRFL